MRRLHIASVQAGDRLARPILRENGHVLLGQGVELNARFIQRLQDMGVDTVFIEDRATEGIEPEDTLRDETRKQAVDAMYKTMNGIMDLPSTRGRAIAPEMGRTFRSVFGSIMQDLVGRKDVLVNLTQIQTADAYLFQHSVNVAVLAGIMGIAKGYNRNQLEDLGIGAMLFDIGMTKVPQELLNRKAALTPEEKKLVQRHTTDGFDILRSQHDISLLSAHCALQHHERYDGSGYPRGLRDSEIHEYAQIVGIADVYDALTSPRAYRQRHTPAEAIEFLFAAGNSLFDLELIRLFCKHISIYPLATTVVLNTGQVGVVSANDPLALHRPTIRIVTEADGSKPRSSYDIDLKNQLHLMIVKEI
ncbi:HD-GYP domain-containing protein [Paenibacillus sp. IB182496]|uniref:HD-GYP domain-containing protein n=1 Tax=Paenibacillus sabuli TaxID=2772509 RepID=A0A927BSV9_9BACL|nr:HD-GYP domain-containing protein [Paenibacillus sabuli]MBD2844899.1 HD-GYP domain-containing protein [Paenibacillus sabuli]